jgi:uroporphyrinogen decarboxylase
MALQRNLDPGALLGSSETMAREARRVLSEIPDHHSYVFNLGHGVLPETNPERVAELVDLVHAEGRKASRR